MAQTNNYNPEKTVRLRFYGKETMRDTTNKDRRFLNMFMEPYSDDINGEAAIYYITKRPGRVLLNTPSTPAAGRGIYYWKGATYTVFGNKIYKDTTALGVTLTTTTGKVSIKEVRPGAAVQYLCINDGTALYCINTSGTVLVLNNVGITSSSVANPTTITTSAPHNLTTGNQVNISGHTGSTPAISGVYTVTVTGANTFTIPVNVTVGGTGGSIGVFPVVNTGDLEYMDGYMAVLKADASLWTSNYDDPTTWNPSNFILAQMFNGIGVGLAKQNNYIIAFLDRAMQFFYDAANATGSPLANSEQAAQQIGCASSSSIASDENIVYWVSNTNRGSFCIYKLDGTTNLKEISTPYINRILEAEGASINQCYGFTLRRAGNVFYILTLVSSSRTFVWNENVETWTEWTDTNGTSAWPIGGVFQNLLGGATTTLLAQHQTAGTVHTITFTNKQDDSVNYPWQIQTQKWDADSMKRKFYNRVELVYDIQPSSAPITISYTDDDYQTFSTPRTFDMSSPRIFDRNWGQARRRAWRISGTNNQDARLQYLEFDVTPGND